MFNLCIDIYQILLFFLKSKIQLLGLQNQTLFIYGIIKKSYVTI